MKKKSAFGKLILIFLLLAILLLAVLTGIVYYLAVQDNISSKYTLTERDENIKMTVVKGSVFGRDFDIEEIQINTFINDRFCREKTGDNIGIDHIRFYFYDDRPCEIYAHAFYQRFSFALCCKADFDVDESSSEVRIKLYDARIGELDIPENILNMVLEKMLENSDRVHYISSGGRNVSFTAEYTVDIPDTSGITIGLKEAAPGNAVLKCRTNSLSGEALKAGIEYISSEEGKEKVKGLIGHVKEKVGSLFEKEE